MKNPNLFEPYRQELYPNYTEYLGLAQTPSDRAKRKISVLGTALQPLVAQTVQLARQTTKRDIAEMGLEPAKVYEYHGTLGESFRDQPRVSHNVGRFNDTISLMVRIPVGDYGLDLARGFADTVEVMYKHAPIIAADAMVVKTKYKRLFQEATFQIDPLAIVQEASLTTAHGLSLLTLDRVSGYEEDPRGLVQAVTDYQLLHKLAARIPLGFVGPFANHGYKFSNPVVSFDDKGHKGVKFSEEFEQQLKNWRVERNKTDKSYMETGMGCPFARSFSFETVSGTTSQSGVDYFAEAFLQVLDLVYEDPNRSFGRRLRQFINRTRII